MERADLSRAKEMATRENWDYRLPQYDKEADDGAGPSEGIKLSTGQFEALTLGDDPWNKFSGEDIPYDFSEQDDTVECEPGESEVRSEMGSLEDIYEQAGVAESLIQEGGLSKSVKTTLAGLPSDVRESGDRTVLVDLSYLKPGSERTRTASIIERVIGIYSTVQGTVKTEPSGKRGIFRFQVTHDRSHHTPPRFPSPPPSCSKKQPRVQPRVSPTTPLTIPELENGILLSPKYPGLPKCVLKYGQHGLTPDLLSKLRADNPDAGLNQLLEYSLNQTKGGKRVLNMYKLAQ